jgi:hypothetical protein
MPDDIRAPATTASPAAPPRRGEGVGGEVPDTREPDAARQTELRAAYEANVAADTPPYQEVPIRTRGEVEWILRERNWSVEHAPPKGKRHANLSVADLFGANLIGVNLTQADLSRANLSDADLREADLGVTTLRGAEFVIADLRGAILDSADLSGAKFLSADLRGTDLRAAHMDTATILAGAKLDRKTRLREVVWNGVPLQQVSNWPTRLGDEEEIEEADGRTERIGAYRVAARAYRQLALALSGQGLLILASHYRLRE